MYDPTFELSRKEFAEERIARFEEPADKLTEAKRSADLLYVTLGELCEIESPNLDRWFFIDSAKFKVGLAIKDLNRT